MEHRDRHRACTDRVGGAQGGPGGNAGQVRRQGAAHLVRVNGRIPAVGGANPLWRRRVGRRGGAEVGEVEAQHADHHVEQRRRHP